MTLIRRRGVHRAAPRGRYAAAPVAPTKGRLTLMPTATVAARLALTTALVGLPAIAAASTDGTQQSTRTAAAAAEVSEVTSAQPIASMMQLPDGQLIDGVTVAQLVEGGSLSSRAITRDYETPLSQQPLVVDGSAQWGLTDFDANGISAISAEVLEARDDALNDAENALDEARGEDVSATLTANVSNAMAALQSAGTAGDISAATDVLVGATHRLNDALDALTAAASAQAGSSSASTSASGSSSGSSEGLTYTGAPSGWRNPLPGATVTSTFGYRSIFGGVSSHQGIDLAAPSGTTIVAPAAGVVVSADYNSISGYWLAIDHGGGVQTIYRHIRSGGFYVNVGEVVSPGEAIAAVGSTGRSTGPHLHLEVLVNGSVVNPQSYFGNLGVRF